MEGTLYNPNHFAAQLPDDTPIVFYIGAMASGHLTKDENPEASTALPTDRNHASYRTPVLFSVFLHHGVFLHNQGGTTAEKGGFRRGLSREISVGVRTLLVVEK